MNMESGDTNPVTEGPDLPLRAQPWAGPGVSSLDCGVSYQPLNQNDSIRLLKLHPHSDNGKSIVECTLSERSMEGCKGEYVALSYTWGDAAARPEIIVNGKPAFITENLYHALTHIHALQGVLGGRIGQRELWVDAICINQQDAAEKFAQVAKMRDVFADAKLVIAWMGLPADGSDEVLRSMAERRSATIRGGVPDLPPQALHAFLNRDWWKRMWILQEFMVQEEVWFLCGYSCSMMKSLFKNVDDWLACLDRVNYYVIEDSFWNLLAWRMYLMLMKGAFLEKKELDLMSLMELARDSNCTDPRDRVFALLGLMGQDDRRLITCDYNSSPCEVFCNAIRVMAVDSDRTTANRVVETVELWKQSPIRGTKLPEHDPLQPVVPARGGCDGISCSSQSLCITLPAYAKISGKRAVQGLMMGYRSRENRHTGGEN